MVELAGPTDKISLILFLTTPLKTSTALYAAALVRILVITPVAMDPNAGYNNPFTVLLLNLLSAVKPRIVL